MLIIIYYKIREKQELKEATDIYESVIGSNKSFWDEVNERKSKRTAVDGKRATKQNLINSAFGITESTIEYNNINITSESPSMVSATPAKRNVYIFNNCLIFLFLFFILK